LLLLYPPPHTVPLPLYNPRLLVPHPHNSSGSATKELLV
jgi:hypothetical protein